MRRRRRRRRRAAWRPAGGAAERVAFDALEAHVLRADEQVADAPVERVPLEPLLARLQVDEVAEQKGAISKLKEELQQVKSKTTVDSKYSRRESLAKAASTLRQYRQAERQAEAKIRGLDERGKMEEIVHKQTVEFLKRKQKQLEPLKKIHRSR